MDISILCLGFVTSIFAFHVLSVHSWGPQKTCESTVKFECPGNEPVITITEVRASDELVTSLLKHCQLHYAQCEVSNPQKECIHYFYACRASNELMELKSSATTHAVSSKTLTLINEGYLTGQEQTAQDVQCTFTLNYFHSRNSYTCGIEIYELSPFINSTQYCFHLNDYNYVCTGSEILYLHSMQMDIGETWKMSFKLNPRATFVPRVRFSFQLTVSEGFSASCTATRINDTAAGSDLGPTISPPARQIKHWQQHKVCERVIKFECPGTAPVITITDVRASDELAASLLKKCQRRHARCEASNPHGECVRFFYTCQATNDYLELKSSATTNRRFSSQPLILVNEGYLTGKDQTAQDVQCTFTLDKFYPWGSYKCFIEIYEFSPFITSTQYCVYLNDYNYGCSGSSILYMHSMLNLFAGDWRMSIKLSAGATSVPRVRFYIRIAATESFSATCTTKSVTLDDTITSSTSSTADLMASSTTSLTTSSTTRSTARSTQGNNNLTDSMTAASSTTSSTVSSTASSTSRSTARSTQDNNNSTESVPGSVGDMPANSTSNKQSSKITIIAATVGCTLLVLAGLTVIVIVVCKRKRPRVEEPLYLHAIPQNREVHDATNPADDTGPSTNSEREKPGYYSYTSALSQTAPNDNHNENITWVRGSMYNEPQ